MALTQVQKQDLAAHLLVLGHDVQDEQNRATVSEEKFSKAIEQYRGKNKLPEQTGYDDLRAGMRRDIMIENTSVDMIVGLSNMESQNALEVSAIQNGLQALGYNAEVNGAMNPETKGEVTRLVSDYQTYLDGQDAAPAAVQKTATVEEAQAYLRILGYEGVGPVDNIRGPLTNGAIAEFTRANNLSADLSLNDLTAALRDKVANDPAVMARVESIVAGGNGTASDIKAAQYALNARGAEQIKTDGIVGNQTMESYLTAKSVTTGLPQVEIPAQQSYSQAFAQAAAPRDLPDITLAAPATAQPLIHVAPGQETAGIAPQEGVIPTVVISDLPDAGTAIAAAQPEMQSTAPSAATAEPSESPRDIRMGERGRLSSYQRQEASREGGPGYNYERPPSAAELRREQMMQDRMERQEAAQARREAVQMERDINRAGRHLNALSDNRQGNDMNAAAGLIGIAARRLFSP